MGFPVPGSGGPCQPWQLLRSQVFGSLGFLVSGPHSWTHLICQSLGAALGTQGAVNMHKAPGVTGDSGLGSCWFMVRGWAKLLRLVAVGGASHGRTSCDLLVTTDHQVFMLCLCWFVRYAPTVGFW